VSLSLILIPMAVSLFGALGCLIFKNANKDLLFYRTVLTGTMLEFAACLWLAFSKEAQGMANIRFALCGFDLSLEYDGFRKVYTLVLSFMWLMSSLFSGDYFRGHGKTARCYFFLLLTLGAIMGVFLAGDLLTALIFFEIMSFASFPWVIQEETEGAIRAAETYLAVAVIGGLAALMGLFLIHNALGTLELSGLLAAASLQEDKSVLYAAGICILVGFGAKAGMFPLHIWLPKAHPVAPAPASALLSGALTKSGIWGILAITVNIFRYDASWGKLIFILGVITMVLGAVMALFCTDLKRTLACSSMSQIGFILIGTGLLSILGMENVSAARGTLLHMVNHSVFKLVLFLCAGCVFMNAHSLDLNEIRGFGKGKLFLNIAFLFGAAGIAGIPGLNGYISKTLLHEGIVEAAVHAGTWMKVCEWLFLLSGGLTLAYMTKLYVCLFVEKPASARPEKERSGKEAERSAYMSPRGYIAIGLSALLVPVLGLTAGTTMNAIADLGAEFFHAELPREVINFFSLENLKGGMISILIGALVYLLIVRKCLIRDGRYVNVWPAKLDLEDMVYRPLLLKVLPGIFGRISVLFAENRISGLLYRGIKRFSEVFSHILCDLTDAIILLLKKTVFKDSPLPITDSVYHSLPYRLGSLADRNLIRHHKEEEGHHDRAEMYVRSWRTIEHSTHRIMDSISAALLLLVLAICATLIYVFFLR